MLTSLPSKSLLKNSNFFFITALSLALATVISIFLAMRLSFFFNKVLNYNWSDDVIIRPRRPKMLPHVLSKDEILSIMDQVVNLKHKTILMTTYSSGLRISETLNLRISDIDSKSMLIRVNHGKGNKDRLGSLS